MNRLLPFAAVVVVTCLPSIAFAHPGHGFAHDQPGGLIDGLLHPLTGIDHLLSLIAVAAVAVRLGGRALWAVPAAFLMMGIAGGGAASLGWSLPMAHVMVTLTVLVGGLALWFHHSLPRFLLSVISLFGLFHGNVHFNQVGANAAFHSTTLFAGGLLITSLGVTLAVITLARQLQRLRTTTSLATAWRFLGGALAVSAIALMLV